MVVTRWTITYTMAMKMTNAELLHYLVNEHNVADIQRVVKERVVRAGLTNFYELLQKEMMSSSLLAVRTATLAGENPDDPKNYLDFYQRAMDEGYRCEGMREPESALKDVQANLLMREPWEALFEGGQKFYLSFRRHYYRWKAGQVTNE